MNRLVVVALCAGLLAASAASAQTGPGRGMGGGQGMGPGMGPGGGAGPMHQQMFGQLDTNKDGVVSRQEFVDAPRGGPGSMTDLAKEQRGARFDQLDKNKDGKLTPDEWGAGAPGKQ